MSRKSRFDHEYDLMNNAEKYDAVTFKWSNVKGDSDAIGMIFHVIALSLLRALNHDTERAAMEDDEQRDAYSIASPADLRKAVQTLCEGVRAQFNCFYRLYTGEKDDDVEFPTMWKKGSVLPTFETDCRLTSSHTITECDKCAVYDVVSDHLHMYFDIALKHRDLSYQGLSEFTSDLQMRIIHAMDDPNLRSERDFAVEKFMRTIEKDRTEKDRTKKRARWF